MAIRISPATRSDPAALDNVGAPSSMGLLWAPLYIVYSFVVGTFLLVLPWMDLWDNNYIVYHFPGVGSIVSNSFFKGAVLGLGIVNILIGLQEIAILWKRSRTQVPN